MEWMGTRVAEDVVHNLRMAHMQVWKLYTAVHDLQAAAVREGVEVARHRKQQKEELCEMKKEINEINRQMAVMKLRLKSLQKQEQKEMLADEKWQMMKDQLKAVMIQMNEIYAELREIRGQKTEQTTTVTTTTRVTGSSSSLGNRRGGGGQSRR